MALAEVYGSTVSEAFTGIQDKDLSVVRQRGRLEIIETYYRFRNSI